MRPLTATEILRRNRQAAQKAVEEVGAARLRKMLERAQRDLVERLRQVEGLGGAGKDSFTSVQARGVLRQVEDVLRNLKGGMRGLAIEQAVRASERQTASVLKYLNDAEKLFTGVATPLPLSEAAVYEQVRQGSESSVLRRIGDDPNDPAQGGVLARYGEQVIGSFEEELQQRVLQKAPWEEVRSNLIKASPFLQGKPAFWAERIIRTECLLPETRISGAVVGAALRRWYEGDVVEIVTEGGREFTATPNHPMLTRRGWVAAGSLNERDDLVCNRREQRAGTSRDEHVADGQPTIGEVFDALAAVGVRERRRTAEPDFHGDGCDGEVDIARPFRPLVVGRFAAIRKPLAKHIFTPPHLAHAPFCLACGHLLGVSERVCLCGRAQRDTRIEQPFDDQSLAHFVHGREATDALACLVALHDLVHVDVGSQRRSSPTSVEELAASIGQAAHNAGFAHGTLHEVNVQASPGGDLICAEPGDILFDRVRSVRFRVFRGHVFNLSTPNGYFAINGAYTGNTMAASNRSSLEAINVAESGLGDVVKILSATFDNRTAADSYDVHGQIRRTKEPFNDWNGKAYMHPPNRPNDREVVVPHRLAWPIPDALKRKSDGECAAAWAREGRRGPMPSRSKHTTVDLALFGKAGQTTQGTGGQGQGGQGQGGPQPGPQPAPPPPQPPAPRPPRPRAAPPPPAPPPPPQPQRFIEPEVRIAGRDARGIPTFEREGRPVPLSGIETQAVETLVKEPDLGKWLVGSNATLKHDTSRPYEAALRAHAGGDIAAAVSAHGRGKSMKMSQIERLTFEREKLDPDVAAQYAAKLPAGAPVIVKWRGKYYVRDGGEHLAAAVAVTRAMSPALQYVDVQLVDLDKVPQPARPVGEWAKSGASAMKSLAAMQGSADDAAQAREHFRELLLDRGIVTRDDERATYDTTRRVDLEGGQSLRVEPSLPGAYGFHDWQGRIVVEKDVMKRAADVVELLTREDPAAFRARPVSVQNALLTHVSTLVHEELHGSSPVTSTAYQGAGVGLEEAATEILARKVVRELVGHQSATGATALGLPTRKPDGSYRVSFNDTNPYFGSYNGYIGTLLKETGDVVGHDGVHAKVEAALLKTRSNKVKDRWRTPEKHIEEYATALGLTGQKHADLVQRLTREFPRSAV